MMFLSARGLSRSHTIAILTKLAPNLLEKSAETLRICWNHDIEPVTDTSNIWAFFKEQADQGVDLNKIDPQTLQTRFANHPRYNKNENALTSLEVYRDSFVVREALRARNTRNEPIIGLSQMENIALRSMDHGAWLECEAVDLLAAELCQSNREYISTANMQILMAGISRRDHNVLQYACDHIFTDPNATSWASVINPHQNHWIAVVFDIVQGFLTATLYDSFLGTRDPNIKDFKTQRARLRLADLLKHLSGYENPKNPWFRRPVASTIRSGVTPQQIDSYNCGIVAVTVAAGGQIDNTMPLDAIRQRYRRLLLSLVTERQTRTGWREVRTPLPTPPSSPPRWEGHVDRTKGFVYVSFFECDDTAASAAQPTQGPNLPALGAPYSLGGKLPDSWRFAWVILGLALLEVKAMTLLALNKWFTDHGLPIWSPVNYRATIARHANRFTMRPQTVTDEMKANPMSHYREDECSMIWYERQLFAAAAMNEPIYLRFPFDIWLPRSLWRRLGHRFNGPSWPSLNDTIESRATATRVPSRTPISTQRLSRKHGRSYRSLLPYRGVKPLSSLFFEPARTVGSTVRHNTERPKSRMPFLRPIQNSPSPS